MTDFHTHILPSMDDGAQTVYESVEMLLTERKQGVGHVFLTPHFYADEDDPSEFLRRRDASFRNLTASLSRSEKAAAYIPKMHLGAEVYYFPGISDCEELKQLSLGDTGCILIEPPMSFWSETMLEDIEAIGPNLGLVPVIAHVDRYCRILKDNGLFDRLHGKKILNQVNASFFLHEDSKGFALRLLEGGTLHLLGSDCHNTSQRMPNLGPACRALMNEGYGDALNLTVKRMTRLVERGKA